MIVESVVGEYLSACGRMWALYGVTLPTGVQLKIKLRAPAI